MKKYEFDVFVSHARGDADVADDLAKSLQDRGLRVFLDRDIPSGENWAEAIQSAMEATSAFVVVVSGEALRSKTAAYEMGSAVGRARTSPGVKLIPILRSDVEQQEIPFSLKERTIFSEADLKSADFADRLTAAIKSDVGEEGGGV